MRLVGGRGERAHENDTKPNTINLRKGGRSFRNECRLGTLSQYIKGEQERCAEKNGSEQVRRAGQMNFGGARDRGGKDLCVENGASHSGEGAKRVDAALQLAL